MSVFNYNGVTLPYPYASDFRQEPAYDDLSSTDWYCTKFDIRLQAILNADYINTIDSSIKSALNAADVMNQIRIKLLKPRRTMSYTFGGVELIPQGQGLPGTVDVANGPKPQSCVIKQLTNTTFIIDYHIIAHYWEITPSRGLSTSKPAGNPVLYNRWSESLDIDICGYTRQRVRDGKFIIRSDNVDGKVADQITASMAIIGVPNGFLRESSHYTVSPDGLGIQYRLVDKEVYKMPPPPAFEASGEYTETSTRFGGTRECEVHVRLRGSKATVQSDLIYAAIALCSKKIKLVNPLVPPKGKGFGYLDMMTISVDMFDNVVDCRMRAKLNPLKNIVAGCAGLELKAMAVTPLSDETKYQPRTLSFGTASLLLRAAAYYDPSLRGTKLNRYTGQLTAGLEVGTAGKNKEA